MGEGSKGVTGMKNWGLLLLVAVVIAAVSASVIIVRRTEAKKQAEREQERRRVEEMHRASAEVSERIKKAGDEGYASATRSLRKLQLEGKMIGKDAHLTPDEAAELRILREREAQERVDALGKEKPKQTFPGWPKAD